MHVYFLSTGLHISMHKWFIFVNKSVFTKLFVLTTPKNRLKRDNSNDRSLHTVWWKSNGFSILIMWVICFNQLKHIDIDLGQYRYL